MEPIANLVNVDEKSVASVALHHLWDFKNRICENFCLVFCLCEIVVLKEWCYMKRFPLFKLKKSAQNDTNGFHVGPPKIVGKSLGKCQQERKSLGFPFLRTFSKIAGKIAKKKAPQKRGA